MPLPCIQLAHLIRCWTDGLAPIPQLTEKTPVCVFQLLATPASACGAAREVVNDTDHRLNALLAGGHSQHACILQSKALGVMAGLERRVIAEEFAAVGAF